MSTQTLLFLALFALGTVICTLKAQGCGNTMYTELSGTVMSPNYPQPHNNNANCTYSIRASQPSSFTLTFQSLSLERCGYSCTCDWVQIKCADGSYISTKYCGYTLPSAIYINNCIQVLVLFRTDGSVVDIGFALQYVMTRITSTTPRTTTRPGCGNTEFTESSGIVMSPNYPRQHNNYDNCTYSIRAAQPSTFALTFQRLSLETCGTNCICDWVQIRCADGSYISPRYCGYTLPTPIYINNCNQVLVWFRTDGSVVDIGFTLQYVVTRIASTTRRTSTVRTTTRPGCGNNEYTEPSGNITSPNYPRPHTNNANCTYSIRVSQPSSFTLTFQSLSLERCGYSCTCDWVQIRCADASYISPKYCGSTVPMPVSISNCNQVLVWFRTDGSLVDIGFALQYVVTRITSTTPRTSTERTTTTPAFVGCGNTEYTESTGIVTSPNYPGLHNNNDNCTYSIRASQPSSFALTFQRLSLESCGTNCTCDWVQIRCADTSYISPKYCGYTVPSAIYIYNCNQVLVWFRTDYSVVDIGFTLRYVVTRTTSTTPRITTATPGCGNTEYTESYGIVTSPNYPGLHNNNDNCTYSIRASQPSSFALTFQRLSLESCGTNCTCDWVQIRCADASYISPKYCGYTVPSAIYIYNCNQVLVWFRTDYSVVDIGFTLQYVVTRTTSTTSRITTAIPGCGNTEYTESSGIVTSPNYPGLHNNNDNCTYSIRASQPSSFALTFQRLSLESCGTNCTCDWVQIRCADASYISPKYCGYTLPSAIYIYNCNQVLVWFRTDYSVVDIGFTLQYVVTRISSTTSRTSTVTPTSRPECGNTEYTESSGTVTSPNYPGLHNNNDNCTYSIRASQPSSFALTFQRLSLESCGTNCTCDWVQIRCADASYISPRYCGYILPSAIYIYNCNQVLVWFRTDHSVVDIGFTLQYVLTRINSTSPRTSTVTTTTTTASTTPRTSTVTTTTTTASTTPSTSTVTRTATPAQITTTQTSNATPPYDQTANTSTTQAIASPVARINTTPSIYDRWEIPFIVVAVILATFGLVGISLATAYMIRRNMCPRTSSTSDTELLDTISTNDYSTTPADSGISFENVAMEADA